MEPSSERSEAEPGWPDAGREPPAFTITEGPSSRALHRLHLARPRDETPRAWLLVALAWLPLGIGGLVRIVAGDPIPPLLTDLSVHARVLVGIPLLVAAERLLGQRCRGAIVLLYHSDLVDRAAIDSIIDRAKRLRDSRAIELLIFALAIAGGQALLVGALRPTEIFAGQTTTGAMSFVRIWYTAVAWPIVTFLLLRWLWRWALWSYVIARVSRLPLATNAAHPDHAAGLGFLATPLSAFASFVFAVAAMLAAAWGTQLLTGGAVLQDFVPELIVFVVVALAVACGPLTLFAGQLYRARVRDLAAINLFALEYVRQFRSKWLDARPDEDLVSTPDISALNDLCGSYASIVQVRLVPFGTRQITPVLLAAVIPMLPLAATILPLHELARRLASALFGGLPI